MKQVRKTVLLWYSPREIYDLVTAVERYPEFLPWCAAADVLERHDESTGGGMTARLSLSYAGLRHAFTTRNTHELNSRVRMQLVDGPFSLLDGDWRFLPLNKPGTVADGGEPKACKIEFELRYAFSSFALEAVVSPVFDRIANTFVDSFVKRAEQVYGPR
ncbi:Ribosome association toxin PasT (RatA) of the RatAB toxin-antitoxin module [Roseateles sp. YR242]|uniref:type II toxin-antitoxin system RatA family toxin n=1 Tax=Roseateles sp. YR242 TaxID=1855305 RepID=UPI0008AC57FE|nr:type II toxin-antitoxin system RatA family toxin [Roseateles sp. YR242]SEK30418.1 Ribosome association toxin PasT (RatA) of the RatAB toxin-antitoxin module [Roseateles sp. YR242]